MTLKSQILAFLLLLMGPVAAQSVNYKNVDVTAGAITQLDYYATGKKDCTSAPPPTIKIVTAPKHGLLTLRRGMMTTNKIQSCPNLQTPANVIFYTGSAGYAGVDEIVYEVTDAKGEVALYNIRINVKTAQNPTPNSPGQKSGQIL